MPIAQTFDQTRMVAIARYLMLEDTVTGLFFEPSSKAFSIRKLRLAVPSLMMLAAMSRWLLLGGFFIASGAPARAASRPLQIPSRATLGAIYNEGDWRETTANCDGAQRRAAKASSFGCYKGYSTARYTEFTRTSRYVTVADGTRLAVDVYLPAVNGVPVSEPLPVVFDYSRYWRAEQHPDGSVATYVGILDPGQHTANIAAARARAPRRGSGVALLLTHGYIFVRAEARGTGASFGVRNGDMSGVEARDGRDLIDWMAKQPWSNGKIGMIGGSYEGMSQYLLASIAPKPLKAIFPMVAPFDEYHSSWSGTGVMKTYGLAWLAHEARRDGVQKGKAGSTINPDIDDGSQVPPVDEDTNGALRAAARKERLSDPDAIDPTTYFTRQSPDGAAFVKLLGNALGSTAPGDIMEAMYSPHILADLIARTPGLRDKINALHFYRDASAMLTEPQDVGPNNLAMLAPRIRESGIAIYNWGGWRDFATIDTLLWDANLRTPKKLTMGPWSHSPNEPGDFREAASRVLGPIEKLRWLDYWLKGIDNGIMREPAVTYAVLGDDDRFAWKKGTAWQGKQARRVVWALSSPAALTTGQVRRGQVGFTVDPATSLGAFRIWPNMGGMARSPSPPRHSRPTLKSPEALSFVCA